MRTCTFSHCTHTLEPSCINRSSVRLLSWGANRHSGCMWPYRRTFQSSWIIKQYWGSRSAQQTSALHSFISCCFASTAESQVGYKNRQQRAICKLRPCILHWCCHISPFHTESRIIATVVHQFSAVCSHRAKPGVKTNCCVICTASRCHGEAWQYTLSWWCLCVIFKLII